MSAVPYEIERKYLIAMPDINILKKQKGYSDVEITQIYISDSSFGGGARIRKSVQGEKTVCTKTFKRDITSLKRIEIEEEITTEEFERLKELRDKNCSPIHKHRHSFEYRDQLIEIDIYDFWQDRATAEVELKSEEQRVELPEFIKLIKEVTDDGRYRNYSLAKSIFTEDIQKDD